VREEYPLIMTFGTQNERKNKEILVEKIE